MPLRTPFEGFSFSQSLTGIPELNLVRIKKYIPTLSSAPGKSALDSLRSILTSGLMTRAKGKSIADFSYIRHVCLTNNAMISHRKKNDVEMFKLTIYMIAIVDSPPLCVLLGSLPESIDIH